MQANPDEKDCDSPIQWFDTTTLHIFKRIGPVGLSRVEANVVRAALDQRNANNKFCKFNRYAGVLEAIERSDVEDLLGHFGCNAPTQKHPGSSGGKRRSPMKAFLRQAESKIRVSMRSAYGKVRSRMGGIPGAIEFRPDDSLVISGSTWDALDADWLTERCKRDQMKLVAVLCDMIPWKYPHHFEDQSAVRQFLRFADVLANHAAAVASISKSTDDDFREYAKLQGISNVNSRVILLGSDLPAAPKKPESLPADLFDRGYVLCVGTIQVRKNHQLLYQLWRRFAEEGRTDVPRLVIAGGNGWLADDLRTQMKADPLIQDSIVTLNGATDANLAWLYQNCMFSVYPSIYEGWGLPIVECLQHGRPCLASSTSSMPEAGQGLARHLDPQDFASWHDSILKLASQRDTLESMAATIRQGYQSRSWESFGSEFLEFAGKSSDSVSFKSTTERVAA